MIYYILGDEDGKKVYYERRKCVRNQSVSKGSNRKYLDRRLHAVQLLGEGMKPKDNIMLV